MKSVHSKTDKEKILPCSEDEPFAVLAFKVMTDPFVGSLTFMSVSSEHITSVLNTV